MTLLYGLLGNRGQGDVRVGNALDGAGGALGSLDTDTWICQISFEVNRPSH